MGYVRGCLFCEISIHALLAESDFGRITNVLIGLNFYPRSPCGERRRRSAKLFRQNYISIHALLAESDWPSRLSCDPYGYFYPRSPCGERQPGERHANSQQEFLSTLSLRRATWVLTGGLSCDVYFYPRSPCGERPVVHQSDGHNDYISIHALLAESDKTGILFGLALHKFLSTLSLRRATCKINTRGREKIFLSTLSLRRATNRRPLRNGHHPHFYPRSPCGERQLMT